MKLRMILATAALVLAFGTAHAFELGPIDVHGFVSQGYLKSSANNYLVKSEKGSFEFNEVGVNFSAGLSDNLWIGLQLLARDLGEVGNNEVLLDWGSADYRWRNELGIRLGKIKSPYGLYNEIRDNDSLRTWVLLPQSIYQEVYRDQNVALEGGSIYGTINAGRLGSFEYQELVGSLGNFDVSSGNLGRQISQALTPFQFLGETLTPDDIDATPRTFNDLQLIWNTPLEGLRIGATWTRGKLELEAPAQTQAVPVDLNQFGFPVPVPLLTNVGFPKRTINITPDVKIFSGEYRWNNLTLAAEYSELKTTTDYNTPDLAPTMAAFGLDLPKSSSSIGYYASIAYRFTDWLELGTYYSVFYRDKDDKDGSDLVANAAKLGQTVPDYQAWQKDTCVTARFDITPAWTVKLEGHHMNGAAMVFDYDDVNDISKTWTLYAAKASFSF